MASHYAGRVPDFTPDQHREARRKYLKRARKLKGRRSVWTTEHEAAFQAGPHYDRDDPLPPGLVKAPRLDTLTDDAEWGRQRHRDERARNRAAAARDVSTLVTEHPPPWRAIGIDELPSPAAAFARAATRAGLTVAARAAGGKAVQVGVRERDRNALWMRATWRYLATRATPAWSSDGVHVTTLDHHAGVTEAKALLAE